MLIDKLKNWQYYYQKLPLYVRNSYGTAEHFRIIFDLLVQLDKTEEELLRSFDIFSPNYLSRSNISVVSNMEDDNAIVDSIDSNVAIVQALEIFDGIDFDGSSTECDILDKIAAIYGVSRTFDVNVGQRQSLNLTNDQLLLLIKQRIIQYNYDGTYKSAKAFYESVGLPIYIYNSNRSGKADLYLNTTDLDIEGADSAIYYMFLANMFTIESMGIRYELYAVDDMNRVFVWDSTDEDRTWDNGLWL